MMTVPSHLTEWAEHQARHENQPETRNAHDVLVSLCQLAEEQLAELRRLNARAQSSESRSSAEIDSNGCAGRIKVKIKCYGETVEEASAGAMVEFTRAMAELEQAQLAGWKATLDAKSAYPCADCAADVVGAKASA
jgi:hypothetical protein